MISYKLEKAAASMKRLRFETLLNPASITREAGLLLLGFRIHERSVEQIGGAFRYSAQSVSLGRAVWAAELMTEIFWSRFLAASQFSVETVSADFRVGPQVQLSFSVPASEREQILEQIHRQTLSVISTPVLARSPQGLVVGNLNVGLRVRSQFLLGGA